MYGESRLGAGPGMQTCQAKCVDKLRDSRAESNKALLRELREDPCAEGLLEATRKDAALGRMAAPLPLQRAKAGLSVCFFHSVFVSAIFSPFPIILVFPLDVSELFCLQAEWLLLNPRFGVEQVKPNGTRKLRPIDNLSWSSAQPEVGQAWLPARCVHAPAHCNVHVMGDGRGREHVPGSGVASMGTPWFTNRCTMTRWTSLLWAWSGSSVTWGKCLALSRLACSRQRVHMGSGIRRCGGRRISMRPSAGYQCTGRTDGHAE